MNPLAIWWRTHRLERMLLIGFLVLVVVVGLNVWRTQSLTGQRSSTQSGQAARPTAAPTASAAPTPVPTPDPGAVAQAEQVGAAFLVAWASYRWDDTPQAQAERLQPYATAQFAGTSRLSPTMAEQRQTTREVASAQVTSIQLYGQTASGQLGFGAQVVQNVTSTQGANSRTIMVLISLQQTPQGWRVSGIDK